jgi:hypothetical protein
MKKTTRIFLSYARQDKDKVEKLYRDLSSAGFDPWMDTKSILPGEDWPFTIKKAIRESDLFLACISEGSINKRGVLQKEIKDALDVWYGKLDSDIYLIPVRLDNCELPENLSNLQWVNLFERGGSKRLIEAIQEATVRRGNTMRLKTKKPVAAGRASTKESRPRSSKDFSIKNIASAVAYCPLCDKYDNQHLIHVQESTPGGVSLDESTVHNLSIYYIAICQHCLRPLLYWATKEESERISEFHKAELVWPKQRSLHDVVPPKVRECYADAIKIGRLNPKAFAGQIRLALELICDDKNISKGTLSARLKTLLDDGHITNNIFEMTESIRHLSNLVLHTAIKLEVKHTYAIDEYFCTVVEHVYVVPYTLEANRNNLDISQLSE